PAAVYHHALAAGFARGFLVSAAISLLALAVAIFAIRVSRADLAGGQQPRTVRTPGRPGSQPPAAL
ncbi:MAG: hypothetical protein J2P33_11890, partial [Actinobacteria bacterium]|nr:hypothetical protein [Actinomycetota bacterium]